MDGYKKFPHDAAYKTIFGYREIVESLLKDFVGEDFVSEFDFDSLQPFETQFTTKDFSYRMSDMVWRVKWKHSDCYICILLEFQSTSDEKMAIRVLEYSSLLLSNLIKKGVVKTGQKLPAIFPIVIYNGDSHWTATQNTLELIETPHPALKEYQPQQRYFVVDEKHIPVETVEKAKGLVKFILKAEQAKDKDSILSVADNFNDKSRENEDMRIDVVKWMELKIQKLDPDWNTEDNSGGKRMLYEILEEKYALKQEKNALDEQKNALDKQKNALNEQKNALDKQKNALNEQKNALNEQKNALYEQKNKLEKQKQSYIEEGIEKGIEQGIGKEIVNQKSTLLKMIALRFGDIPQSWEEAIKQLTDSQLIGELTINTLGSSTREEYEELINKIVRM